jgi:hypothetical protein
MTVSPPEGTQMPKGVIFWVLMILWAVYAIGGFWVPDQYRGRFMNAGSLLMFVLLFLLGWATFGFVVQ